MEARRDVHMVLPPDANVQELPYVHTEPKAGLVGQPTDTACPCRGARVDEDGREDLPADMIGRVGLGFASAAFLVLAAWVGWQLRGNRTHAGTDHHGS